MSTTPPPPPDVEGVGVGRVLSVVREPPLLYRPRNSFALRPGPESMVAGPLFLDGNTPPPRARGLRKEPSRPPIVSFTGAERWTNQMIARIAAILVAALFVLPAAAKTTLVIKAENATLGLHLTDGRGVSLYLFEEDRQQGDQHGSNKSDCVGDCLVLFSPVAGDPAPIAGTGVDARLIGSLRRPDGRVQATYNGWPLYYFGEDLVAGDIHGHQFNEFGGDWYLVAPTGREFGGRLAFGVDYQKSEECGCQETVARNVGGAFRETPAPTTTSGGIVGAMRATTFLAVRFVDDFPPADKTAGATIVARRLAARALPGLATLASAQ